MLGTFFSLFHHDPPQPHHIPGVPKAEELVRKRRENGRGPHLGRGYRSARDSTSVNPQARGPILPIMPNIPPQ
ncbi:MAG TPA: hypothetical protein VFW87_22370 [Pirellulales bacterium]|nr:hypothetical protein [Pirellulales bacterium]